jgi:hypothetical protein
MPAKGGASMSAECPPASAAQAAKTCRERKDGQKEKMPTRKLAHYITATYQTGILFCENDIELKKDLSGNC